MSQYVIRKWKASDQPVDDNNHHVSIAGRAGGLLNWLLSLLRIDPTVTLTVSAEEIRITEGSFAGRKTRIVPLESVCSTYYGYNKPWKTYLLPAASLAMAAIASLVSMPFFALFIVPVIGVLIVLYFLNKSLTIAFVENSGVTNALCFKRSVIEGKSIGEDEASYVADLTQALIDNRKAPHRVA